MHLCKTRVCTSCVNSCGSPLGCIELAGEWPDAEDAEDDEGHDAHRSVDAQGCGQRLACDSCGSRGRMQQQLYLACSNIGTATALPVQCSRSKGHLRNGWMVQSHDQPDAHPQRLISGCWLTHYDPLLWTCCLSPVGSTRHGIASTAVKILIATPKGSNETSQVSRSTQS
jgi:hypothetical protein